MIAVIIALRITNECFRGVRQVESRERFWVGKAEQMQSISYHSIWF